MTADGTGRKCYASALGDCEGPLTREHYVSKHALEKFEVDGKLNVTGLRIAHLLGERGVTTASLTAKFLCEKHNNALSPVDTAWGEFLMEFFTAHNALLDGTLEKDTTRTIDGTLLERWLLKYACGLISSGNAQLEGGMATVNKTAPPVGMLRMVFGLQLLDKDWGWYTLAPSPKTSHDRMHFGLTPTYEQQSENTYKLAGVILEHYGFINFVRLTTPLLPIPGLDLSQAQYRPEFFEMSRESTGRKVTIRLNWPTSLRNNGFKVIVVAPGEKPPRL